ncbi:hypothetical protein UVI_02021580 [Ustilaginoidea virens]|uniref:Uncharacterized protein n=1 Tax=Ustilaginoidea virens TaxID=1159556 RepID=A0A1B5KXI8_USTVR|nr:hypothetical protein UVI_02021580 [Ustilaginoidea virens]
MAAAATVTAGFRGPAKRAAFGDVTNTKIVLGKSQDGKLAKVQTATGLVSAALINKENAPYSRGGKDSFAARPAQRPSAALSSKPGVVMISEPGRKQPAAVGVVHDVNTATSMALASAGNPAAGLARPRTANALGRETILPAASVSFDAPPLQPRHHKSQPHLKQQQRQPPLLRRTQSRQFEMVDLPADKATRSAVSTDPGRVPSRIAEEQAAYDDLSHELDQDELLHHVNHADGYAGIHPRMHHISEEAQQHIHVVPSKESQTQALSEPEEYWDEEEDDDYEDQDQAYTTAHSFRSQNLTTGGVTTILAPRVTTKVQRELEEAKLQVQQTRSLDDIEEEMWDVSMVAEYGEEIFEYMRELEIKMQPNPHYMEMQTEIQWSMRSVLMDWLVQVHNRFSLLPETLFLTVNYIDRFLSCKIVSIGKLQLVGATAILVASKYEEINCPSLDEIVYMVDGGYTTEEILKAERFMLSMLSFELGWPGPMSFLRRVSKADDYDLDTRTLAKYFLELTIMDERFVASPPSFLAAGAHCLSRLVLKKGDWVRGAKGGRRMMWQIRSKAHVHYSGYTWTQLRPLVTMMIECCEQPRLHHAAVFEKYQEKRFKEASTIVQHALDAGFTLPHHSVPIRPLRARVEDVPDALQYPSSLLVSTEG